MKIYNVSYNIIGQIPISASSKEEAAEHFRRLNAHLLQQKNELCSITVKEKIPTFEVKLVDNVEDRYYTILCDGEELTDCDGTIYKATTIQDAEEMIKTLKGGVM